MPMVGTLDVKLSAGDERQLEHESLRKEKCNCQIWKSAFHTTLMGGVGRSAGSATRPRGSSNGNDIHNIHNDPNLAHPVPRNNYVSPST